MEEVIAGCAQRILALLEKSGEVNVLLLSELLSERSIVTYQALGWLARDGRILYEQRGNQSYVKSLPPRGEPRSEDDPLHP